MSMNKGNKKVMSGLLGGLILVIVLVLIYLLVPPQSSAPSANTTSTNTNVQASTSTSATTLSVPPVSATTSYQLTMPDGLLPLYASSTAKLKVFSVSVTKNGFSRDLIVVNQGDGVGLSVKAVDGTYDLFFPQLHFYSGQIAEGQSTFMSLVPPKAGEYDFECQTYCPYGNRITGKLVVLPQ